MLCKAVQPVSQTLLIALSRAFRVVNKVLFFKYKYLKLDFPLMVSDVNLFDSADIDTMAFGSVGSDMSLLLSQLRCLSPLGNVGSDVSLLLQQSRSDSVFGNVGSEVSWLFEQSRFVTFTGIALSDARLLL